MAMLQLSSTAAGEAQTSMYIIFSLSLDGIIQLKCSAVV